MSRDEKLIAKIRARPSEADFRDVKRLLEDFGWVIDRERGSHVTFVKGSEPSLLIVKHGGRQVKRGYLDRICERLGLDESE